MVHFQRALLYILSLFMCLPLHAAMAEASGETEDCRDIWIMTDRDIYIAGEIVYFKLHVLKGEEAEMSDLVYLVLRSFGNENISNRVVRVTENSAWGSIYLPDTLSTGQYQLVCITQNMKGSGSYSFKQLFVANRFDLELKGLEITGPFLKDADLNNPGDAGVNSDPLPGKFLEGTDVPATEGDPRVPVGAVANTESVHGTGRFLLSSCSSDYGTREKVTLKVDPVNHEEFAWFVISVSETSSLAGFESYVNSPRNKEGTHTFPGGNNETGVGNKGILIKGHVKDKNNGNPLHGVDVFLSTPDQDIYLLHALTLEDGSFSFHYNDPFARRDFFINLRDPGLHENSIIEVNDIFHIGISFSLRQPEFAPDIRKHLLKSQDIVSINRHFNISYHQEYPENQYEHNPRPRIYHEPAQIIRLDDYIPMDDLPEISREIIPSWRIRIRDGQFNSRVLNGRTLQYFDTPPDIFLDGVHITRYESISSLGSRQISKIEVHNLPWRYGDAEFSGIVSLISRTNVYRSIVSQNTHTIFTSPESVTPASILSPEYCSDKGDLLEPDFRQSLFWKPDVIFNPGDKPMEFSFFTGDLKGDFKIRLMGVSGSGQIIFEEKNLTVR